MATGLATKMLLCVWVCVWNGQRSVTNSRCSLGKAKVFLRKRHSSDHRECYPPASLGIHPAQYTQLRRIRPFQTPCYLYLSSAVTNVKLKDEFNLAILSYVKYAMRSRLQTSGAHNPHIFRPSYAK